MMKSSNHWLVRGTLTKAMIFLLQVLHSQRTFLLHFEPQRCFVLSNKYIYCKIKITLISVKDLGKLNTAETVIKIRHIRLMESR